MERLSRERATALWQRFRRIFPTPPTGQIAAVLLSFLLPLLLLPRLLPQTDGPTWRYVTTWLLDKGVTRIIARPMGGGMSIYVVSAGG